MTGPHDRFFRYIFSSPARAEALLRHNLPVQLAAEVDWSTLRRESGTLVEWERETRLHHRAPIHNPSVDGAAATRLRLAPHHPLARGTSQEQVDSGSHRFGGVSAAGQKLVSSLQVVDDLSVQSEQSVLARLGPALVPLGLLVLTFAGTEELARRLPHWSKLFAQVHAAAHGPQALYRVVRYLHQFGDEQAHAALRRVLDSFMQPQRAEALMRTMAEILREEGHQQGWLKGLIEGKAEGEAKGLAKALLRLLASKGVHVDDTSRQRIHACRDAARLERWLERALSATRLSEVLDDPAQ